MFTCNNMNRKFKQGKCGGTPNEDERIIFSLYFAYFVDVATDLTSTFILTHIPRHPSYPLQSCSYHYVLPGIPDCPASRNGVSLYFSAAASSASPSLLCVLCSLVSMVAAEQLYPNRSGCCCGPFWSAPWVGLLYNF
jgi:hypothetical protein